MLGVSCHEERSEHSEATVKADPRMKASMERVHRAGASISSVCTNAILVFDIQAAKRESRPTGHGVLLISKHKYCTRHTSRRRKVWTEFALVNG